MLPGPDGTAGVSHTSTTEFDSPREHQSAAGVGSTEAVRRVQLAELRLLRDAAEVGDRLVAVLEFALQDGDLRLQGDVLGGRIHGGFWFELRF